VLTKAGFNPVDVSVTFVHSGSSNAAASDEVTVATPSDADDVASLAGRCFTYSRFHADPHVRKDVADAVKREWARNACKGRAAVTYIVRYGARIAGFLAVLTRSNSRGKDAVIDLISVDPAFQGKGLGRALSTRFIQDWRGQADRLVVGTQAANIPAMQLYEGLGFRIHETAFVLHAHLENGKVME
jgi:ribosomal protein S18 acetylase RimI-like enzyme